MSDESTIRVNFGRPMPLFPLNSVVLFPHGVVLLHIFEERYRQMVNQALDGAGQIAMAVHDDHAGRRSEPVLKPAVCIGQIRRHQSLPDGRLNIQLQGVCRARIVRELPADSDRLYRTAILEPIGMGGADEDDAALSDVRQSLREALADEPLSDLVYASDVIEHLGDENVPTHAVVDVLGRTLLTSDEQRYRFLEEGDTSARADLVQRELATLAKVLRRAAPQRHLGEPKGCYWN